MYDTFVIISSTRFTQNDLYLAKKAEDMRKSFFFVRSKIDNDIRSERRKKGFDEAKVLENVKNYCTKYLQSFNFSTEKIFLISNYDPREWDFDRLKKAILDGLPSRQRESLTFAFRSRPKSITAEKVKGMCTVICNFGGFLQNVNCVNVN